MRRSTFLRSLLVGGVAVAVGATAVAVPLLASAATNLYEAESATISQATVATNHAGFTGTGFVDYDNVSGSYVEFTVPASAAGSVTLTWRYANGSTTDRPVAVTVNGSSAGTVSMPGTGAWTTWKTATTNATLASGTNKIRATATTANGGANLDSLTVTGGGSTPTDWSQAVVKTITSTDTPSTIGGCSYPVALYLYGQYLVYQRTHDPKLLTYIEQWADRFVQSDGTISNSFTSLDSMEPGLVLDMLYSATHLAKYKTAATTIYNRLEGGSYPRTADGALWHATSRQHQLWGDGTFMALPFLVNFGALVGSSTQRSTAYTDAINQLILYNTHLQDPNGLLYHAYDESGAQSWVVPGTKHSPETWCRATGWYAMATTIVLDTVPTTQPNRSKVLTILQRLVTAMKKYQDPATGRWFQVVDKGSMSDNWTETSCSSMFTYTISRAVERGYVDPSFKSVATAGYLGPKGDGKNGVLGRISLDSSGHTQLTQICIGTNVGDYAFYIGRPRATNDFHGLGSFLIMSEQLRRTTP
jgi:unsaturated rhamnogalacturonyl hydrolase